MQRKSALVVSTLSFACLLAAQNTRDKVETRQTEHMTFEPSAVVHLENILGHVKVEGWTRPDVEVTIVKATKDYFSGDQQETAAKELDKVKTSFTRKGEEIVVASEYKQGGIPGFRTDPPVDITYEIKMPQDARLVIDQNSGDVSMSRLLGDIRVTMERGSVTAFVPSEGQYSVDAKSKFGTVTSNLATAQHGLYFLGERLDYDASKTQHKIVLRAKFGDIVIVHAPAP
ncbi:MAG: DUF4097 family beta strand repeat protein [Bryobacterales bacterium]|nr:DUF4097 family beta strand repeat protein [Bryobacterales bacterium]